MADPAPEGFAATAGAAPFRDRPELDQPPITLVVGEHLFNRYTVRDPPAAGQPWDSGPVKNLTGASVSFSLRNPATGARIVKTGPPGVVIVDAAGGLVDAIVPNTETAPLPEQTHKHELRVTQGGVERAVAGGPVLVVRIGF